MASVNDDNDDEDDGDDGHESDSNSFDSTQSDRLVLTWTRCVKYCNYEFPFPFILSPDHLKWL